MSSENLPEWLPTVLAIVWVALLFIIPYVVPIMFARHIGRIAARNQIPQESLRFIDTDASSWSRRIVIGVIPTWIALGCMLEFQWDPLKWSALGLSLLVLLIWFGGSRRITRKLLASPEE
jgi:hypothetical protein